MHTTPLTAFDIILTFNTETESLLHKPKALPPRSSELRPRMANGIIPLQQSCPEDIWFAILSQLSLYINAHAEELRSFFVAHEGQKALWIHYGSGSIHTIDNGRFAQNMGILLSKNVNDPDLHPWIMPAFSTTTDNDRIVASVIMMGALQKYFTYGWSTMCALPSVTLLGEKSDWELLLQRIEKLPQLGEESTLFYALLKPVITQCVQSFVSPASDATRDFWQKIIHRKGGSGVVRSFCSLYLVHVTF